ncbi:hypothetical protein DLAC_02203 [Tieghemostelium lacteum]|uniref:Uncharacterized protein n=1 Tax=Tieghemostelium lacteum TaxID=361077 RepID=A0A152A4D5_TIELA|nr:hypothetical protein DLAC_02203 [Tieghemostelium lacteum]|eukprot:KYR01103.1 hypothetical protein DLAC_02203 [Tieghemostelium lacteum]
MDSENQDEEMSFSTQPLEDDDRDNLHKFFKDDNPFRDKKRQSTLKRLGSQSYLNECYINGIYIPPVAIIIEPIKDTDEITPPLPSPSKRLKTKKTHKEHNNSSNNEEYMNIDEDSTDIEQEDEEPKTPEENIKISYNLLMKRGGSSEQLQKQEKTRVLGKNAMAPPSHFKRVDFSPEKLKECTFEIPQSFSQDSNTHININETVSNLDHFLRDEIQRPTTTFLKPNSGNSFTISRAGSSNLHKKSVKQSAEFEYQYSQTDYYSIVNDS